MFVERGASAPNRAFEKNLLSCEKIPSWGQHSSSRPIAICNCLEHECESVWRMEKFLEPFGCATWKEIDNDQKYPDLDTMTRDWGLDAACNVD